MTDKQQPEALRLADELEEPLHDFPEPTTLEAKAAAELRRLHTESEMRRVALLDEMQKAALAAGQATAAQQPGAAYAALPDGVATLCEYGGDVFTAAQMRAFANVTCALRAESLAAAYREELDKLSQRNYELRLASHGQASAQAAPAAVAGPSDLRARCEEILAWQKTGVLPGEALRTFAREKYGDEYDAIQRAERDTETEALNFVIAAPTTQPAPGEQNESAYQRGYMDGMAKGRRDVEAAPQQEAQDPCPTCAALARTVMLDQASFDRKPDCYGIRQITDDEGVEEWEDIHTSPDVAREEANYMMATGRGEIYEVVPLWTTPQPEPQPSPAAQEVE